MVPTDELLFAAQQEHDGKVSPGASASGYCFHGIAAAAAAVDVLVKW